MATFDELFASACAAASQETYRPLYDLVRGGHVSEEQLHERLAQAVAESNWNAAALAVGLVIVKHQGSARFVPLLAEVLDAAAPEVNHEDVVDLLDLTVDPRAIPALQRAALRVWPSDTFSYWINRKALWALARYGDPAAWETIRTAADWPIGLIREEAERLLAERAGD